MTILAHTNVETRIGRQGNLIIQYVFATKRHAKSQNGTHISSGIFLVILTSLFNERIFNVLFCLHCILLHTPIKPLK